MCHTMGSIAEWQEVFIFHPLLWGLSQNYELTTTKSGKKQALASSYTKRLVDEQNGANVPFRNQEFDIVRSNLCVNWRRFQWFDY